MAVDMGKRTSKINVWKPKPEQVIVERDGKLFICHFDKVFNNKDNLSPYEIFIIGKESYINQLDIIVGYTNFFINNYDFDNELVTAYLKIKFALDKRNLYDASNMMAYIDFIYEVMFTDTMVDKIVQMVEENYLDDIETVDEDDAESEDSEKYKGKKKYVKNEKKHLESLEFTNQHIKILLGISFGMKIMSPVLFHYIQKNNIKIEKDSDIIFKFYQRLFLLFGYGNTYDLYDNENKVIESGISEEEFYKKIDNGEIRGPIKYGYDRKYFVTDTNSPGYYYMKYKINIYNKLYVYVKAKVLESNASNAPIFAQREIFGTDIFTVVNQFTKKVLISENIVKYKFNENWDAKQHKYRENIVGFNKTILKFQLSYFLKDQYSKNLTEVTNTKNSDGLSGADKLLMNSNKLDEGAITMSDINIRVTITRIKRLIDVPYTEDEVKYYMYNHRPSKIQTQLVYSFYAKYFGSYSDLNLLTRHDYMTLLVILKKKLLLELGYEGQANGEVYCASLPYILTGNLEDKLNTRVIRNTKFISKIEESYIYKNLIENKYKLLEEIAPESIISILSSIINSRFSYVVYEYPELYGQEILYSDDKIADELLFFLNSI